MELFKRYDMYRKPHCPEGHNGQQPVGLLADSYYCPKCDNYYPEGEMLRPLKNGSEYEVPNV